MQKWTNDWFSILTKVGFLLSKVFAVITQPSRRLTYSDGSQSGRWKKRAREDVTTHVKDISRHGTLLLSSLTAPVPQPHSARFTHHCLLISSRFSHAYAHSHHVCPSPVLCPPSTNHWIPDMPLFPSAALTAFGSCCAFLSSAWTEWRLRQVPEAVVLFFSL